MRGRSFSIAALSQVFSAQHRSWSPPLPPGLQETTAQPQVLEWGPENCQWDMSFRDQGGPGGQTKQNVMAYVSDMPKHCGTPPTYHPGREKKYKNNLKKISDFMKLGCVIPF